MSNVRRLVNNFWRGIGKLVSFDLTGRTWTREIVHPRLGKLTYFGSKKLDDCYWEAEVEVPGQAQKASATMKGTSEGPTEVEELFVRTLVANLDLTFEVCREAFNGEYLKMGKGSIPEGWRSVMRLDGFGVPLNGDRSNEWDISFFVEPLGHYFTASLEAGTPTHVSVDG
jgi:hypothetical protein